MMSQELKNKQLVMLMVQQQKASKMMRDSAVMERQLGETKQQEKRLDKEALQKISFEQRLQELMEVEQQLQKKLAKTKKRA